MSVTLKSTLLAALVAGVCLLATGVAAWTVETRIEIDAEREFAFEAQRVEDAAREEIEAHLQALTDLEAFINASWPGSSAGFRSYVDATWTNDRYPAMTSSAGFIERVAPGQVGAVIARERLEDPSFDVSLSSAVPDGEDWLLLNRTGVDAAGGVAIRGLEIRLAAELLDIDLFGLSDGLAIVPIGPEASVIAEPLGLNQKGVNLNPGIVGSDVIFLDQVIGPDGSVRGWVLAPAKLGNLILSASGISSSPLAVDVAVVNERLNGQVASFIPDLEVAWASAPHATEATFDAGGLTWTVRAWAGSEFGVPDGTVEGSTVWTIGALIASLMGALAFARLVHSARLAETRFELSLARTLAETDPLTGLLNRQGLQHRLEADPTLARGAALLFIDLDGFKAINDLQGHSAGDRAIVDMARAIRVAVRAGDLLARLGGDEFIAICPGLTDTRSADPIAARVCAHVAAADWLDVSASVGVVLSSPSSTASLDTLIARADAAMYEAKRSGGGRVVYAEP